MNFARRIWCDLRGRHSAPVAAYKFPITYLICSILDSARRLLAWLNSRNDSKFGGLE